MKCVDAKEMLSAYIDGIMSSEENNAVGEHLKSCASCRNALTDLKNTIKEVQNIQEVEPPPWFEKQVMARVKAESKSGKRIIERLFFPLHIKLPLEALATIAIVATSIYVYKATQPDLQMSEFSLKRQAPDILSEQESRFSEMDKNIPASKIPVGRSMAGKEKKISEDIVKNAPEELDVLSKKDERLPFLGSFEEEKVLKESSVRPLKSREKIDTLFDGKETDNAIMIHVENVDIAFGLIKSIIEELGGNVYREELEEDQYIIKATLGYDRTDEFFSELEFVGKVSGDEFGLPVRADNEGSEMDVVIILSERQ